jgi:hypothetical protein
MNVSRLLFKKNFFKFNMFHFSLDIDERSKNNMFLN